MRPSRPAALAACCAIALAACTSDPGSGPSAGRSSAASRSTSVTSAVPSTPAAPSRPATTGPDWPTYHGTPDRAGLAPDMPAVTGALRVRADIDLDGAVYASPIVVDGITIVATENDTVYAFDPAYRQLWKAHLGRPSPAGERPCGNIDPLGITGTPVYDAGTDLVYVSPEFGGPPRHDLVALRLRDGSRAWQRSIDLPGTETKAMQERGGLAITGGRAWVPFGGLAGDCGGYKGRVVGVPLDGTGAPIAYTVPTTREAGIWTPPGPTVDADGNLLVAVGNGESGVGDRYDFSDSVLKISPTAKLLDSFSPTTWPTDNEADLDLGSQGPAIVGQWIFIAGKSGTAYVLRRAEFGGIGGEVSSARLCGSFGGTAVDGDVVYVPCTDGVRAVRVEGAGTMHVLWHAESAVTGSPVIGGGRVWALDTEAETLHALDPTTGASRESIRLGAVNRFATPAISGSDVIVPTLSGMAVVTAG